MHITQEQARRIISEALDDNYDLAKTVCRFCNFSAPFPTEDEATAFFSLPRAEMERLKAERHLAEKHDSECVVVSLKRQLGDPEPELIGIW